MKVWVGDRLVDESAASVPVLDHGLTVGDGVFETLKVYAGRAFALTRHLERLGRSAGGLGIVPPDPTLLRAAVEEVVGANRLDGGAIRITVTSGPGPLGSLRGPGPPTV
ncbi:MAG TPA: aminotransferase class IV, partial [Acidimicrobiales bacterium]|nr:aminotransferase class IV [Acidimicrobiales bacterium]